MEPSALPARSAPTQVSLSPPSWAASSAVVLANAVADSKPLLITAQDNRMYFIVMMFS
jgi:hypothetical protein